MILTSGTIIHRAASRLRAETSSSLSHCGDFGQALESFDTKCRRMNCRLLGKARILCACAGMICAAAAFVLLKPYPFTYAAAAPQFHFQVYKCLTNARLAIQSADTRNGATMAVAYIYFSHVAVWVSYKVDPA